MCVCLIPLVVSDSETPWAVVRESVSECVCESERECVRVCVSVCVCLIPSVMSDSETPWAVARLAPLSMGFSRREYCSGWPCPPPGDLPHPGIEPASLMSPALTGRFFTTSATWEAQGEGLTKGEI